MDKKELLIMSMLRTNSRETLTKMSRKIRIPVSTIYDKIKQYENKFIKKHTCIIDFSKLGFMTRATILLSVKKEQKEEVVEFLTKHHHINSVFKINNGFDILTEAVFKQIKDIEEFLELLSEKYTIKKYQVHYIIDDVKRENFLSTPEVINLLEI